MRFSIECISGGSGGGGRFREQLSCDLRAKHVLIFSPVVECCHGECIQGTQGHYVCPLSGKTCYKFVSSVFAYHRNTFC